MSMKIETVEEKLAMSYKWEQVQQIIYECNREKNIGLCPAKHLPINISLLLRVAHRTIHTSKV